MKTIKITIEVLDFEEINTNPFIEKGLELQKIKELKEKDRLNNEKIKKVHESILSNIKANLYDKLKEAKIPFSTNEVFNPRTDLYTKNRFNPLYGSFKFSIRIKEETLVVKIVPIKFMKNGRTIFDGDYTTLYTTKSNIEQMKFGKEVDYTEFKEVETLEKQLLNFLN